MNIANIKKVIETEKINEVNKLVQSGYRLLNAGVREKNGKQQIYFSLGKL